MPITLQLTKSVTYITETLLSTSDLTSNSESLSIGITFVYIPFSLRIFPFLQIYFIIKLIHFFSFNVSNFYVLTFDLLKFCVLAIILCIRYFLE